MRRATASASWPTWKETCNSYENNEFFPTFFFRITSSFIDPFTSFDIFFLFSSQRPTGRGLDDGIALLREIWCHFDMLIQTEHPNCWMSFVIVIHILFSLEILFFHKQQSFSVKLITHRRPPLNSSSINVFTLACNPFLGNASGLSTQLGSCYSTIQLLALMDSC